MTRRARALCVILSPTNARDAYANITPSRGDGGRPRSFRVRFPGFRAGARARRRDVPVGRESHAYCEQHRGVSAGDKSSAQPVCCARNADCRFFSRFARATIIHAKRFNATLDRDGCSTTTAKVNIIFFFFFLSGNIFKKS